VNAVPIGQLPNQQTLEPSIGADLLEQLHARPPIFDLHADKPRGEDRIEACNSVSCCAGAEPGRTLVLVEYEILDGAGHFHVVAGDFHDDVQAGGSVDGR
jgi:hypothetical protein